MRMIDADALKEYILRSVPNWSEDREIVLDCIANSPTIEERKKGKWISNSPTTVKCDKCGYVIADWKWHESHYCTNCGADMRGGEDGE